MNYEEFYNDIESLLYKYKDEFKISKQGTLLDKIENVFYDYSSKINEASNLEDNISDLLNKNSEYKDEIDSLQSDIDFYESRINELEESVNQYRNILLQNNLSEYLLWNLKDITYILMIVITIIMIYTN